MSDAQLPVPGGPAGGLSGQSAEVMKQQTAAARAEGARKVEQLRKQQEAAKAEFERQRAALEAQLRAKMGELNAVMEPLKAELAKLQEVAWTVDLYLGRDEELTLLRDGAPAPSETPITIRQRVLVMAEESLVLLGKSHPRGMAADNIDEFVQWLLAAPENLDRVLPEPKGVVVMIPTRVTSQSGNRYEDAARDAANQRAHWLIRNGERLYLLTTDPVLSVRDRLVPLRDEFLSVFEERLFGTTVPVEPGSERWLQLEAKADARRRHFMRLMLVLQGLVDRTPAWHPLPPGGVNLLSVAAQDDGRVRIVQDADTSIQLGDGHETFAAWQTRLNKLMRPGLRIVGDWNSDGFRELSEGNYGYGDHPRLYPPSLSDRPKSGVPHLIEDRRDGGFVIRFERSDDVWRRNEPVPGRPGYVYGGAVPAKPKVRASCVVKPDDEWVLPFDLASEADLTYFLNSREERGKHFLSLVPVLRSALTAKQAEAREEAPFRQLLSDQLVSAGCDPEKTTATVDELVTWWKVKNLWARALNGDQKHEGKALREIVAEYRRRADEVGDTSHLLAAARAELPDLMCLGRTPAGQWRGYAPSSPVPRGEAVWVDVVTLRRNGTVARTDRWQRVQQRTASSLHVAWSDKRWGGWNFAANPRHYLTGPERDQLVQQAREATPGAVLAVVEYHSPNRPAERCMATYAWTADLAPEDQPKKAARDVYDTRWKNTSPIAKVAWQVTKTADGVALELSRGASFRFPADFGRYGGSQWGDTPWSPSDRPGDPRLVWADTEWLDRIAAYRDACTKLWKTEQDHSYALWAEANQYSDELQKAVRAVQLVPVRERFDESYGAGADDLWESHLSTLKLGWGIKPGELTDMVLVALTAGRAVVGETLGDLADAAKLRIPDEYRGIVVQPLPSTEQTPGEG